MDNIAQKVIDIIKDKLSLGESELKAEDFMEANFISDLGADSLDTVELIMAFEKEFNIAIPDEDAEKITTVGQAISYMEQHKPAS